MDISVSFILRFFVWLNRELEAFAQWTEYLAGYRDPGGNWIPPELRESERKRKQIKAVRPIPECPECGHPPHVANQCDALLDDGSKCRCRRQWGVSA